MSHLGDGLVHLLFLRLDVETCGLRVLVPNILLDGSKVLRFSIVLSDEGGAKVMAFDFYAMFFLPSKCQYWA